MTPRIAALLGAAVLCLAVPAQAASGVEPGMETGARPVLRVCQDPNNLPFSRRDLAGFELHGDYEHALIRFLDHVLSHDKVWVCRRIDIARHWRNKHPAPVEAST